MDRLPGLKEWLVQTGMEQYSAAISALGVVDLFALSKLDTADLSSLGITKGKEKRRVATCISKLKEQLSASSSAAAESAPATEIQPKRAPDTREPSRSKSRRQVVVAPSNEAADGSMAAGESTESEVVESQRQETEEVRSSRHGGRNGESTPAKSSLPSKHEESHSEMAHSDLHSTTVEAHEEKPQTSAPHLFHTDDTSHLDGTKEYGRSEEDTEIRSSNSVDREHRRTDMGEPEPSEVPHTKSTRKSKRNLHANTEATSTTPSSTTQTGNGSTSTVPSSASPVLSRAATSGSAKSSSAVNDRESAIPTTNTPSSLVTGQAASSGNVATSTSPKSGEIPAVPASGNTIEGQLQVKKGGFLRLTKKWEPRWCTFGGRVFEAFKNKDDKVPVYHIDITKAIVTGSNDRNLQVLELTAYGKRSYWTGPRIGEWIKAMRSMSITSLNAKRRTADYTSMPEIDLAVQGGPSSAAGLGTAGHLLDSSEENYQSLDVATEEEDRYEFTSAPAAQPSSSGNGRRSKSKPRKTKKTIFVEDDSPQRQHHQRDQRTTSQGDLVAMSSSPPTSVTIETPPIPTSAATGNSSTSGPKDAELLTAKTKFRSTPHLNLSTASPSDPAQATSSNATISPTSGSPRPLDSGKSSTPTSRNNPGNRSSITLSTAPTDDIKGGTMKPKATKSERPRVPQKMSSVGNLKPSKLEDDAFPRFTKKSRVAFDDAPCKEAIARYVQSSATATASGAPASPRGNVTSSKDSLSRDRFGIDEDSELEDPYYDDDNLTLWSGQSQPGTPPSTHHNQHHHHHHHHHSPGHHPAGTSSSPLPAPAYSSTVPPHLKYPSLFSSFQIVAPRSASDHKAKWIQRYCTFDGIFLRVYSNLQDAKSQHLSAVQSSFGISHVKVTPIFISRIMCLDIHDEESGRREFWRGHDVALWLPHLERFAGRGYDPILGSLLVRQCHRDESQWVARYCTFNGHQFQSFRHQSDTHPIWSAHIRHLTTRSVKQGGVELMELMLDGGAQSLWWEPPGMMLVGLVRPLAVAKRFNFMTGSVATTSGGDTPTIPSLLRKTAPEDEAKAKESLTGREDDEDEMAFLKTRMSDWISIIREAHEISVGDSERYIADEWELESEDEEGGSAKKFSIVAGELPPMKGYLNYKVGKKSWEPRFLEISGKFLNVMKKKHDKKPDVSIKIHKAKLVLGKQGDGKHVESLEITTNDDATHIFCGKLIPQWYEALSARPHPHTQAASTSQLPSTVDPTELSAAESRSESVVNSSRWGGHEESETEHDDERSEDVRRDPEEQPRSTSASTLTMNESYEVAHRKPGALSTATLIGMASASAAASSVTSGGGGGHIGEQHGSGSGLDLLSTRNQQQSVGQSHSSLLNQSTLDDSTSVEVVRKRQPSVHKSPAAAIESIKSQPFDMTPTSYYSDADDNQFAPSIENMPKPAWTGPVARWRPGDHNWVARYIIFRPSVDLLVYVSKPPSIESVPPLATIEISNVASVVLSTVETHQCVELTDTSGKKHIWSCSDAPLLVDLLESSRSLARSKQKRRGSKRTVPAPASPGASKRTHKLSNMSGSSPALDIPGRGANADKEKEKDKDKDRGSKSPSKAETRA